MKYIPRIVDAELADRLAATGAVVVEGPKACGARAMVDLDPAAVLAGDTPRLIDEWQTEPAIWNHIRGPWTGEAPPASSSSPVRRCPRTTLPATPAPDD